MNIFFRILLTVYAIFLTIISLFAMIITLWPGSFERISEYINNAVLLNNASRFTMFFIAFVVFSLSLVFLFSGLGSSKDKKAVSKFSNIGEINISLDTIENIALAAARKLNGIKETKAGVTKSGEGVSIAIRVVLLPEVNIPALSEDMQARVKKLVEESSGVAVNTVRVIVDNVYTGYRSRVE